MTRVCARITPKFLTAEQKDHFVEIALNDLGTDTVIENVLNKVFTGDESRVYGCDPETKCQRKTVMFLVK